MEGTRKRVRCMPWTSSLLKQIPWLVHSTSTRNNGSLRYPNQDETEDLWKGARDTFVRRVGADPSRLVVSGNRHDAFVAYVTNASAGRIDGVDGLLTDTPGLVLGVKTADCLPIFVVDPVKRLVGLFHAGWKGIEAGMPRTAIEAFVAQGSDPNKLLVAIGPSIRACHYQRSLQDEAMEQFIASGTCRNHIDATAPCTACCLDEYFSYHISRERYESMLSVIEIRE